MSNTNKKGFTIIEVVLVLAIAGLIFLMVFIALPALQRSQRDTQRRQDVSKVLSQLQQYQTNNRGKIPANHTEANGTFLSQYLKGGTTSTEFVEPKSGTPYVFTNANPNNHQMQYVVNQKCDGENLGGAGGGNRAVAVRVKLEGAGYYCQDNQ